MKDIPLEPTAGNVLIHIPKDIKKKRGVVVNIKKKKLPIGQIVAVGENDSDVFPISKNIQVGMWTLSPSIFKNEIIFEDEHYSFVHHLDIRCVFQEAQKELFDAAPL